MTDAAAIIRLCYAPGCDEDARAFRFSLFRTEVLPRILAQETPTDPWVWCHPRHQAIVRRMHPRIQTFTVDLEHPGSIAFEKTTLRGYPWAAVQGLPRYPIQALLGSDDLLGPRFVSMAVERLAGMRAQRAIASFRPIMLDRPTGRLFEMPFWPRPSPMLVLRQPIDDRRYTWVWAEDHRKLGTLVDRVVYLPQGQAVMMVHGYNDGTALAPTQAELPASAVPWL